MSDVGEAAGAIGGLILGGLLLLLMAPTLDPVTQLNIGAWGSGLFVIGVIMAVITAAAAASRIVR